MIHLRNDELDLKLEQGLDDGKKENVLLNVSIL